MGLTQHEVEQIIMAHKDGDADGYELDDVDRTILDFLQEGARTQSYMVDNSEYTRQDFYRRFQILVALGYVHKIHDKTALYELVHDPRTTDDQEQDQDHEHEQ